MIKVLFVCLGNICRSPMAEFIFKDMVNKKGLSDKFFIDSAATNAYNEIVKEEMYQDAKDILNEMNVPYTKHFSRRIRKEDYGKFDYILAMEDKNIRDILEIVKGDPENKIYRILDFTEKPRNVDDPYYYGNFDKTFYDIEYGCQKFLEYIENRGN